MVLESMLSATALIIREIGVWTWPGPRGVHD